MTRNLEAKLAKESMMREEEMIAHQLAQQRNAGPLDTFPEEPAEESRSARRGRLLPVEGQYHS